MTCEALDERLWRCLDDCSVYDEVDVDCLKLCLSRHGVENVDEVARSLAEARRRWFSEMLRLTAELLVRDGVYKSVDEALAALREQLRRSKEAAKTVG